MVLFAAKRPRRDAGATGHNAPERGAGERRDAGAGKVAGIRDVSAAKQQGLLPEQCMGRLFLANAHNVGVVFTIGKRDYSVAAGMGAQDFKQAMNYSVRPGKYEIVIKIPGQEPQTEKIEIAEDSTWAIVALPTGGCLPGLLY